MESPRLPQARTVFMGTPACALPSLNELVHAGARIVGVVTQPDKPGGRGLGMRQSAVGSRATELGISVFKPQGLKKEENRTFLRDLKPDLLVVVAYGEILPKEVLDLPKFGAVNVHFSLLPRWRGPAPVPAAILAGDSETGVTIMKLDEGMDTGPTLSAESTPIAPADTTATLARRLAAVGARLLVPTLARYCAGELSPTPQDHARATVCPMLAKNDGLIDWTKPAAAIARMVRAYDPWPRAFTAWNGQRLIIRQAVLSGPSGNWHSSHAAVPGTVLRDDARVSVVTGAGALTLQEVQLAGRKPLPAAELVRGYPHFVGACLALAREPVHKGH